MCACRHGKLCAGMGFHLWSNSTVRVGLQEVYPLMEIHPTSVHVGDPFEGEGTSQDTTVFAQLVAQPPPSGPKPFYSGHYVPKDTVIIL